jgi:uncharacterized repeat protein (TIGR03847 family)
MTHQVHAFEPPERFVAWTVGPPGERTFFLQARGGGRLVSVALEKVQVSLLAEKLEELLTEAQRRFGVELPEAVAVVGDNEPLDTRSTRSSASAPWASPSTSTPPPW